MSAQPPAPCADLTRLARWVDAGGTWRVLDRTASSVTVALLTCDAGEEMERFESTDPDVVARLSLGGAGRLEGGAEPTSEEGT